MQPRPLLVRERRHTQRYYIALPVEFDGGNGTTLDVSEAGIRLETAERLALGRLIAFRLVFNNVDPGEPWRMAGAGEVIRVEPTGDHFVAAVRVTDYALPEPSAAPSPS